MESPGDPPQVRSGKSVRRSPRNMTSSNSDIDHPPTPGPASKRRKVTSPGILGKDTQHELPRDFAHLAAEDKEKIRKLIQERNELRVKVSGLIDEKVISDRRNEEGAKISQIGENAAMLCLETKYWRCYACLFDLTDQPAYVMEQCGALVCGDCIAYPANVTMDCTTHKDHPRNQTTHRVYHSHCVVDEWHYTKASELLDLACGHPVCLRCVVKDGAEGKYSCPLCPEDVYKAEALQMPRLEHDLDCRSTPLLDPYPH